MILADWDGLESGAQLLKGHTVRGNRFHGFAGPLRLVRVLIELLSEKQEAHQDVGSRLHEKNGGTPSPERC
jgi:hypothetical protein